MTDRPSSSCTSADSQDTIPRRHFATVMVLGFYLFLAVALTYPLIEDLGGVVPNDAGDPLLNTWILWWNTRTLPFSSEWWNAPAFYPVQGVLAFSEHLAGLSLISTPVFWLSGNAQLAYNISFLLTFPLSALASYLLCLELTGRRDAAFIGGLAFGFAPYRIAQMSHIQVLSSYWMPLALLGLHRFLRDGRVRWLGLFGGAWLIQALCNSYYLVYFSVLVLFWIGWFLPRRSWRVAASVAFAWALAMLPLLPVLLRYRAIHASFGFSRRIGEIQHFSADVASVLDASPSLAVWGFLRAYHRPEGELFPGATVIVLVVLGIVSSRGAWVAPSWTRVRVALVALALGFAAVAVSAAVVPWRLSLPGITVSATRLHKPLSLTIACLLGLLITSPSIVAAYRRRSAFAFYVVAAGMMWLLSLGPLPTLWGFPVIYQPPYAWLLELPGFDALRVPARFAMLTILCLSAAAALAFGRVAPGMTRAKRLVLTGAIVIGIAADGWIREMPLVRAPERRLIDNMEAGGAVLELPLGDPRRDIAAMYRSIYHGRPVVNGYSGYAPPSYAALQHGLARRDPVLLDQLASLGVMHIVLDTSGDTERSWERYISTHPGIQRVRGHGSYVLYRLRPALRPAPRSFGPPLPIKAVKANVNDDKMQALLDEDLSSRWESGPQRGTEELVIDLGASQRTAAVVLSIGPYPHDFPREVLIELSQDGQQWVQSWRGEGAGPAFLAAMQNQKEVPITFELGDKDARFIRLRQLGQDPIYYWSVAEVAVLASLS